MDCLKTFTPKLFKRSDNNYKTFKDWVLNSISIDSIISIKEIPKSYSTILRTFYLYLDKLVLPPKPTGILKEKIYLKIDGTYFGSWGCLLVYKNHTGKFVYWNFVLRENYYNYLNDLITISNWYDICGITSDWHGSLVGVVKTLIPSIPHQRCLVHLQRHIESLLTKNPKTEAGRELLIIIKQINHLENKQQCNKWLYRIYSWEYKYSYLIKERTYGFNNITNKNTWWYTHKNLRASYRSLITSKEHLFLHFDYSKLSKDTNGLEVEFKHLKNKIEKHPRLTRRRKVSLMFWYLHLKNLERI